MVNNKPTGEEIHYMDIVKNPTLTGLSDYIHKQVLTVKKFIQVLSNFHLNKLYCNPNLIININDWSVCSIDCVLQRSKESRIGVVTCLGWPAMIG